MSGSPKPQESFRNVRKVLGKSMSSLGSFLDFHLAGFRYITAPLCTLWTVHILSIIAVELVEITLATDGFFTFIDFFLTNFLKTLFVRVLGPGNDPYQFPAWHTARNRSETHILKCNSGQYIHCLYRDPYSTSDQEIWVPIMVKSLSQRIDFSPSSIFF